MWRVFDLIFRVGRGAVMIVAEVVFLPTIMAYTSAKRHSLLIAIVNVLLGSTLIGWAGALIWAAGDSLMDFPRSEPSPSIHSAAAPDVPRPSMPV